MGDVKNLDQAETVKKLGELANNETCLFCTYRDSTNIIARPMSTQTVDEDGFIWFFSNADSHKNREIERNNKVYLMYGNPGKENYLSVEGEAIISHDRNKIEELWGPLLKTWFQGGKNDPNIMLIKVIPTEGYYWDTKHGKMISFLKIVAGALTGKEMDDSIEGRLKL